MRVQPRGTEIHFITRTHVLITICSFDFSCLKMYPEEACVFTSPPSDCLRTDLTRHRLHVRSVCTTFTERM